MRKSIVVSYNVSDVPNSVTSIGKAAFSGYGFTSLTIGSGITSCGAGAFDCSTLTSVTFQGPIHSSAFRTVPGFEYLISPFLGDLLDKFYAMNLTTGTPGTYTTKAPVNYNSVWTKQ